MRVLLSLRDDVISVNKIISRATGGLSASGT